MDHDEVTALKARLDEIDQKLTRVVEFCDQVAALAGAGIARKAAAAARAKLAAR